MAKVVGLVAGIIALIKLTGKTTVAGYEYVGGVKRASKDIKNLLDELGSFSKVLVSLKTHIETNGTKPTALRELNEPDGPIPKCARELEELLLALEPRKGWRGFGG